MTPELPPIPASAVPKDAVPLQPPNITAPRNEKIEIDAVRRLAMGPIVAKPVPAMVF